MYWDPIKQAIIIIWVIKVVAIWKKDPCVCVCVCLRDVNIKVGADYELVAFFDEVTWYNMETNDMFKTM